MGKDTGRGADVIFENPGTTWPERIDIAFEGYGLICTDCGNSMARKYDEINDEYYWECPVCNNSVSASELGTYFFDAVDYYDIWKK